MALNMTHLHDASKDSVREWMIRELDEDLDRGAVYRSKYQTAYGQQSWPYLLREALIAGTDDTLVHALEDPSFWLTEYEKRRPSGGTTFARVPVTAAETLAQGEFSRYYLRAVCAVAQEQDREVVVVRLREVARPRTGSEQKIGIRLDPLVLLDDLRQNIGIDTLLGIPAGPNSGLGVEIA
ncbi:hypothetical protein [Nocardioides lijunqiniae]|uniref:hypothetical protein n=1 Tax=Nocardioides lijunqiniae TaxID=2760832 RepID=UPI001878CA66|nr:hypothetical protein [Nocardioides lijunqiniae]